LPTPAPPFMLISFLNPSFLVITCSFAVF
jgi:hypothetical protein